MREEKRPRHFQEISQALDFVMTQVPGVLRVAIPLGLGKPNKLVNALYERIKQNPQRNLELYTALSLAVPQPSVDLEKRFLTPFLDRHFGKDYPHLLYLEDLRKKTMPSHIRIHEFYFQAGQALEAALPQRSYLSQNYTHAGRVIVERGLNVIFQMIAVRESANGRSYSLSCNPDLTLDVLDLARARNQKILVIGVVNRELPYLGGDAVISEDLFDALIESPETEQPLFAVPRQPIDLTDHWIGLHASRLIEDGGTLQIGIGSLTEALTHWILQRHRKNPSYEKAAGRPAHPFQVGLYGTSEMLMDAFMHLRKGGVLRREVMDQDEKLKRYLHGAFYLGSKEFYSWLRNLKGSDYDGLSMTRVSKVNDLYDANEWALRRQRKKARFFNTCMTMSLFGSAGSDTRPDGQVVSGVGGQYNFVSMAHELEDGRSILMLRSTRLSKGKRVSNIVWSQPFATIPRHLRDIVITEYGIADLRGRSDEECIEQMLLITDAEFQDELVRVAKKNKKLREDYEVPASAKENTPTRLRARAQEISLTEFPHFPFGSDFTPTEERLALALLRLKEARSSWKTLWVLLRKGWSRRGKNSEELERMGFRPGDGLRNWVQKTLLLGALDPSEFPS